MLVDLHHGDISAYNTESGVAFRIRIPVGCGHLSVEEMTKPENHKDLYTKNPILSEEEYVNIEDVTYNTPEDDTRQVKHSRKKNIVLVDDDSEMRAYLKLELQSIYNVEVCTNGKEAWSKTSLNI
jgi:PleD family two-component response regulator